MKLKISIGETYDPITHRTLLPNDDSHPYSINSKNFTGRICIRIRDFEGITPSGTTKIKSSPYFEGNYDKYSIQVQGRFKGNSWSADDIVFGNDFDRKISLPPGSWLGLKILQYIDSGLEADIYSDKPWAYSPLAYTMNKLNIHEVPDIKNDELPPWPSSHGEHIEENVVCEDAEFNNDSERRKYFEKKDNRKNFQIKDKQIWNFDFFNSYVDFNDVAVALPGFKIGILQYWDGQPVRYVCKTRDSSTIFFVIVFQLVPNEEEENDNTITTSKSKEIIRGNDRASLENSDMTPKTSAIWSSLKSPTSSNHVTKPDDVLD